jgi:hypothetical protein
MIILLISGLTMVREGKNYSEYSSLDSRRRNDNSLRELVPLSPLRLPVNLADAVANTSKRETKVSTFTYFLSASKVNFCPPTAASYMRPPFCMVKTITPSTYLAFADAPVLTATAEI